MYEFQTVPNLAPESSETTSNTTQSTKSGLDWNVVIPSTTTLLGNVLGLFGGKTQTAQTPVASTPVVSEAEKKAKSRNLIIGISIGFVILLVILYFIFKAKKGK